LRRPLLHLHLLIHPDGNIWTVGGYQLTRRAGGSGVGKRHPDRNRQGGGGWEAQAPVVVWPPRDKRAAELALLQAAISRQAAGDMAQADALYDRAVRLNRRNEEALHRWALVKQAIGQHNAALDLLNRVIQLNSTAATAYCHRGYVLQDMGRRREAAKSLERAVQLKPEYIDALIALGAVQGDLGAFEAACATLDRALVLDPRAREAVLNKGALFESQGLLKKAIAAFDAGLQTLPADAEMLHRKINCLHRLGELEAALDVCHVQLAARPGEARALTSMANTLRALGRVAEALAYHGQAMASASVRPDDLMDTAMCHLAAGNLLTGFRLYESRWKTDRCAFKLDAHHQPLWQGERDIAGRTVFVWSDEGMGDTVQFVRFVSQLATRGARVVLEAQPALVPLMSGAVGVAEILTQGTRLPHYDLCCPIMSLPLACQTTLDTIPQVVPYLHADAMPRARWRERLATLDKATHTLKVGLCWAGSQQLALDRRRSIAPGELAPLDSLSGVSFVSLQKDRNETGWAALQDWTSELHDFADTAALISELDLVISVDTAVAHVAGALGRPIWLLTRYDACWRWLTDRDDSPWYPTMRLFRQPRLNDWQSVVSRVCASLRDYVTDA
jgi:tetratricopeptide (TPR) repeat protein